MARSRTLHPKFATDAELYDAEVRAALPLRLAFAMLWCVADREGRFEWKPRELKVGCLPFDDLDFGAVLSALASGGFIVRYEAEGKACGHIPNFLKYQKIHPREAASRLPAPPEGSPKASPGRAQGEPRRESMSACHPASTSTSTSTSASTSTSDAAQGSPKARPGRASASAADHTPAMRCVIACNTGLRANPSIGEQFNELLTSNEASTVAEWLAAGVDPSLAERVVHERAKGYKPNARNPQPYSLRYFTRAVLAAHEEAQQNAAGVTPITPANGNTNAKRLPRLTPDLEASA